MNYTDHEHLVSLTLPRVLPGWVDKDDLMQAGRLGLWDACRTWDQARGPFRSWAITKIRFALREHLRQDDRLSRTQRRDGIRADHISLDTLIEFEDGHFERLEATIQDTAPGPQELAERAELWRHIAQLPGPRAEALLRCLVLGQAQWEAGRHMGLSLSRVGQLVREALRRLRTVYGVPLDQSFPRLPVATQTKHLTPAQRAVVLEALGAGKTPNQAAQAAGCSPDTVRHMQSRWAKLGQKGGLVTLARHGTEHMSRAGKAGGLRVRDLIELGKQQEAARR